MMKYQHHVISSDPIVNRYPLGLWYAVYRFVIAILLLIIFMLTHVNVVYLYPVFYVMTLIFYFMISLLQLVTYSTLHGCTLLKHISLFFTVDVITYSVLIFTGHGSDLHLHWLFVIVIFAAAILLTQRAACLITLIAMISLIYPNIVNYFFYLLFI